MATEIWKNIEGFEDYQISPLGRVKSFKMTSKGRLLSLTPNARGYIVVTLFKQGRKYAKEVHRLVMENFSPILDSENKEVDHINRIKSDNRIENCKVLQRRRKNSWWFSLAKSGGIIIATIGIYDVDLHHGASFSISLPLMQSYARLKSEGHQVIMMKPYGKTGRYNKIFYFKDNPRLVIPKKLILDQDKGKCLGFGFYGTAGISPETAEFAPSFDPYDLFSDKVRNKTLYKSIKANSLIDWREKDFAGAKAGKGTTYVNDRNFLMEEDWEDLFNHYDNNIDFIHSIRARGYDDQAFIKLAQKPYGPKTMLIAHSGLSKETFERFKNCRGIVYDYTDAMDLFMQIFISKVIDIPISFEFKYIDSTDFFLSHLLRWNNLYGRISFKEYMRQMNVWDPGKYMNFPYRLLLQQDPTKITYNELVEEYLVK